MNDVDCFVELLAARLTRSQGRLPGLAARDAVFRADALFEAGADLSDDCVRFEQGQVGSSVVMQSALKVAQLAAQVYLATTGGGLAEEIGSYPGCAEGEEETVDGR